MRATPPLSPPFTPPAGGKCRRVAFMAHYAACGVILSLWQKHPQAASCAVRATPKKSSALSLYLSLSLSLSNTPKFSRMSAPMPRGIPHLSPRPFAHSVWRVQCLLQRTKQPSRALLHFTILLLLLLFTRTQTTLLRAFWRVKLCCCAAAAHSQTAAPTHTHTVAEIERQREHTCIQRSQQQTAHSSRFRSLAAPLSLSLSLPLLVRGVAAAECSQTCIAVTCDVAAQRRW